MPDSVLNAFMTFLGDGLTEDEPEVSGLWITCMKSIVGRGALAGWDPGFSHYI